MPTFVQGATQGFANSSAARTLAFSGNVAAGNLLVAGVGTFSSGTATVSLTDSLGQTWVQAGAYATSSFQRFSLWYRANTAGGACTLTVTPSSAVYQGLAVAEYSGVAAASPLDGTSTNSNAGSTHPSTGTVAAANGELVVAGYGQGSSSLASCTVAAPFALRESQLNGSTQDGVGLADDVNAGGGEGATFTLSGSVNWAAVGASFKAAAAAAQGPLMPEITSGPPLRGAPWLARLPWAQSLPRAAPPPPAIVALYAPEVVSGPPIPGAPWAPRRFWLEPALSLSPAQVVVAPSPPIYAPEVFAGPPLRGAPWLARLPPQAAPGVFGAQASQARPSAKKPFVARVPDEDRRTARFTEQVSALLNSLLAQGYVLPTGANSFALLGGALTGQGPPSATTDAAAGAVQGCTYVDLAAGNAYLCISAAAGAAAWQNVGSLPAGFTGNT